MTIDLTEDRYDRQRLITWWDQELLRKASVLVVGAGAIGNEVIKNLALLGVGRLTILDLDRIELSNLARCVLFSDEDEGKPKAEVAAAAANLLNRDINAVGHQANVMTMGLGRLAQHDLAIAGLDNREARRWLNQATRKLGMRWVDGAIEGLAGVARVFGPDGACYECTLGEVDYAILAHRKSCALLEPEEIAAGRTPTTATTASLIAAIQVQEAVKVLHGREDLLALQGKGFVIQGDSMDSYIIEYSEDPECPAHDRYEQLKPVSIGVSTTLGEVVALARVEDDSDAVVELEDEVVIDATCSYCSRRVDFLMRLLKMPPRSGVCPECSRELRLGIQQLVQATDALWRVPVTELGYGDQDVVTVRTRDKREHFVLEVSS